MSSRRERGFAGAGHGLLLFLLDRRTGSCLSLSNSAPPPRPNDAAVLLLVAAASVAVSLSAQTKPLVLVSTAWPPFTNLPGQPRFALDLVEAAFGRIGVSSKTTIVNANQFTTSLLTGQFDGSAAAWKDPERERVLLFSKPYLENRLVLVARRGGDVSAKDACRSQGQTGGDCRRLFLRRPDRRRRRADLRPLAQRGRQPLATAQRQRRRHADGRARRAGHRPELPEGIGHEAGNRLDATASRGICTSRCGGAVRTRNRSSIVSTSS